ncbi:MAG: ATP-dependent helicase/nuclease subunit B [Gammaproteobacteria bacterium]|jgi:ATP-dependent helicase/nuclease subunit B
MKLHFGLEFDNPVFPEAQKATWQLGPKGLLKTLEIHCGLSGHPNNNQHLRIEEYRQALLNFSEENEDVFYKATLDTDQLAAAATLLQMRDELLAAGWNFEIKKDTPKRLKTLAKIEALLEDEEVNLKLSAGFADRFVALLQNIDQHNIPFTEIICNEPDELLASHVVKLLNKLEAKGIKRSEFITPSIDGQSDLDLFKKILSRQVDWKEKPSLKNDGSLLILRAKRDTQAAEYIAQLLRLNPSLRPLCLIPEKNRVLDNAFIQEGLPSLGILSASLARPSLQILKLVTAFLWNPVDPFKILEFVSLSIKPLARDLSAQIAMQMAQTPGLKSANWFGMIKGYFDKIEERAETDKSVDPNAIRAQYNFWFDRTRYDINKSVPKEDVIEIFEYLIKWAYTIFEESPLKNNNLLVLSEQSRRIVDFLEALPKRDQFLSYLELERIVRTVYEPTPILFKDKECEHLPFIHNTSAITSPVESLLWWSFSRNEYEHFFSRWYHTELTYLSEKGITLVAPEQKNNALLWQRPRPVLFAKKQLILVIPEMVNGGTVFTHPLFEEMEAGLEGIENITLDLADPTTTANFETHFTLPKEVTMDFRQLGIQQAFFEVERPEDLAPRESETLTSLENLFYYPYQWVFRHKLRLRKSSILSVIADNTLKGNLAHRLFEKLLEEDGIQKWGKEKIYNWIDIEAPKRLRQEGAVLLMYGREPEKFDFINKVKYAALSLVTAIQKNGWTVVETEQDLNGEFLDLPVRGKADLVLKRGEESLIIDLKWRGATFREGMLKNEEDLQLVMYAQLLPNDNNNLHTAYFIIENGKLIARNNLAMEEATAVQPNENHVEINEQILDRMKKTYRWRRAQLDKGQIEVRTTQTIPDLELAYEGELMHVLEMKNKEAFFDDYGVLIGLVD